MITNFDTALDIEKIKLHISTHQYLPHKITPNEITHYNTNMYFIFMFMSREI